MDEARAAQDFFFAADARGRTALHVAAACGNAQALAEVAAATFAAANETLVAAGLLSGGEAVRDRAEVGAVAATQRLLAARDVFGYTAADTARLRGDTASAHVLDEAMTEGARRLGLPPPPPPPPPASATAALTRAPRGVDDDGDDDEDDGGWSVTHDELLARASPAVHAALKSVRGGADCDIAVIDELVADGDAAAGGDVGGRRLTAEQFLHQHVAAGVPALLRGHARAWPLRADLRRDALLARYGDMDFPVAALPYARSFGGEVSRASLRDYAATALLLAPGGRASVAAATAATRTPAAARVEPPLYIFDAPGKSGGGALALDAQGEPAAPPRWSADALAAALLQRFNATPAFLRSRVPLHAAPPPPPPATLPLRRARDLAAALRELVDSWNGAEAAASTESTPLILCNGGDGEPCADAAPVPKPQFYIGGPGSGAPMHVHKDAFNVLAYGEKRWLLLPPRDAVYSAEPISEWLAAAPARGVIFVPRGWGHAVLNTRTSVGIALEFSAATGLPL